MDYTEQFIRLNCSLMSDYKMMKLNADMKCMGLGLYLETILFLRKQQEYKHDFNELDLLADQWGATVENLQHLIKDFDLFLITEDGYFRCLYLDEVMGYQSKLSEQRAAAGSKGGRSSKKSTVKASAKATTSTIGRGRINEGKNGDTSCMFPVSPRLPGKIPVSGKPGGYSSILSLPSSFRMCSMASL